MTGPTHKVFSVEFAFLTAMFFYKNNVTNIYYYAALIIILLLSKLGAQWPDLDQNEKAIPIKSLPAKIVSKLIHLTGGTHRSWQTHSIDICFWCTYASYYIPHKLYENKMISQVNMEVILIIGLGFCTGWVSHLFADMLNGVGVRVVCWSKKMIAFVPKKLFNLRFNTGNEWEAFNYNLVNIINKVLGVMCLLYPLYLHGYFNKFIETVLNR